MKYYFKKNKILFNKIVKRGQEVKIIYKRNADEEKAIDYPVATSRYIKGLEATLPEDCIEIKNVYIKKKFLFIEWWVKLYLLTKKPHRGAK
jgi:hypothetical protein